MKIQDIKLIIRNIKKDRLFAILNISGLAIGLSSVLILLLFIMSEITFDMMHKKRDRVFRVVTTYVKQNIEMPSANYALKEVLDNEVPQIDKVSRAINIGDFMVKTNNEYIEDTKLIGVDPELFDIFSIEILEGDCRKAMGEPGNIVLSESRAQKYFGNENVVGEVVEIFMKDTVFSFTVKGVFRDLPINSSLQPNFMINVDNGIELLSKNMISIGGSQGSDPDYQKTTWRFNFVPVWFLLKENQDAELAEKVMQEATISYIPDNMDIEYTIQNLKDVHFNPLQSFSSTTSLSGNIKYLKIFSTIGLLVLVLVSVNYIILSIARSTKRAKEIGIRKVIGADKKSIVKLIMSESVVMSLITLPVAITLAELILPAINRTLGLELRFEYLQNWAFTLSALVLTVLIGIISGSYLSFYLARFSPVDIMREHHLKQNSISKVRKALLILQTSIFILLLFSSYIIQKQFLYLHNMPMGFEKENLYLIPLTDNEVKVNYPAFREELLKIPGVQYASGALACPPSGFTLNYSIKDPNDPEKRVNMDGNLVDYDYMEAYGFEFIQGKSFSKDFSSDTRQVILNEKALEELDLEDPIGKDYGFGEIVGIIKDFQIHSARDEIRPVLIGLSAGNIREMVVKLDEQHSDETFSKIEEAWKKFAKITPIEISSIDEQIKARHVEEYRFKSIINGFTVLVIILAAMGLFGSCLYMADQRSKEIGIRKVFGSKNIQIIYSINKEFLRYTFFAMLIALPVGFYAMMEWLSSFAFRVQISFLEFLVSGILSVVIVLLTISYISLKYSRMNPVDSIRYE